MGSWNKVTFFLCISCALLVATALHSLEVEAEKLPSHVLETQLDGNGNAEGRNQFVVIDGKTFYFGFDVLLNWVEAVRLCASFQMRLISLQTVQKHNTIKNYLNTIFAARDRCFWTSGLRTEGMNFMWSSTGEEFSSPLWSPTPNNPAFANSTEHCVCLWGSSATESDLSDATCTANTMYVCEYPCIID